MPYEQEWARRALHRWVLLLVEEIEEMVSARQGFARSVRGGQLQDALDELAYVLAEADMKELSEEAKRLRRDIDQAISLNHVHGYTGFYFQTVRAETLRKRVRSLLDRVKAGAGLPRSV